MFLLLTLLHLQDAVLNLLLPRFPHTAEVATQSVHFRHVLYDMCATLKLPMLLFVSLSVTTHDGPYVVDLCKFLAFLTHFLLLCLVQTRGCIQQGYRLLVGVQRQVDFSHFALRPRQRDVSLTPIGFQCHTLERIFDSSEGPILEKVDLHEKSLLRPTCAIIS